MNNELEQKIDELSRLVKTQGEKLAVLENKPIQLDRLLDNSSKDVIEIIVSERIKNIVVGEFPNKIYQHNGFFGSSILVNSSQGFTSTQESGFLINVKPVLNNEIMLRRNAFDLSGNGFSWDEPFSFKTSVWMSYGDLSDTTFANTEIYILHGERDANLGYAGFKISGSTIKGVAKVKNGSSEILTSSLQTFVDEIPFDLRIDYTRDGNIIFFINDEQEAMLGMGDMGDAHPNIYNFTLKTTSTPITISSSTDATPIVITTSSSHGFATGDFVTITNHSINTNANSTTANPAWEIIVTGGTTFSLTGSTATGGGVGNSGTVDYEKQLHISHVDFISGLTR